MEILRKIIASRRYYLLLALFLSAYIILTVIVVINQDFKSFTSSDMEANIENYGCEVLNYELVCNEPVIQLEGVTIDLTDTPISPSDSSVVLTKTSIEAVAFTMTYQDFLTQIGHVGSNFDYQDARELTDMFLQGMKAFLSVIGVLVLWVGILLYNHVFALIEQVLFTRKLKARVEYKPIYRATMIGWTPILIFNGIARMAFGTSISSVIREGVAFGWLLLFAVEIAIIYFIMSQLLDYEQEEIEIL